MTEYGKALSAQETSIEGLTLWQLPVHGDSRGWFKENWQREKMTAAGLPDFGPVQNNVSFNDAVGTTRGIHAEPWDKWVSVATGRIFGAWVDLREGPGFGRVFTAEIDPSVAVFVPRGVGNSYQTLEPDTAYTYLVNDHWSPKAAYSFVNLADPALAIDWPIPLADVEISAKDLAHPALAEATPIAPRRVRSSSAPTGSWDALCATRSRMPRTSSSPRVPTSTSRRPTSRRPRDAGATTRPSSMPPPTPRSTRPRRRRAAPLPGRRTCRVSPRSRGSPRRTG